MSEAEPSYTHIHTHAYCIQTELATEAQADAVSTKQALSEAEARYEYATRRLEEDLTRSERDEWEDELETAEILLIRVSMCVCMRQDEL